MKSEPDDKPVHPEYFADNYGALLESSPVPLAHIRQSYSGGGASGLNQHVDHYALYIVRGGRGIHTINGHPYGIARGDVYVSPPGSVHSYRDYHDLTADAFCFQIGLFSPDEIEVLRSLPGFRHLFVTPEAGDSNATFRDHRVHLSPAHHTEAEAMIAELRAEMETPTLAAPVLTRLLFFRLLVFLARLRARRQRQQSDDAAFHTVPLAAVLRYCEEHYDEPLSVSQLAGLMFLSPSRFSEIFKRDMGVPPATYLRSLRLERAQTLLRGSTLAAADIAHRTGFTDAAQFSKAFRAAFSMTPTEYRTRFR